MLGGGNFTSIGTKVLPGSYINFQSIMQANEELSSRGYAAIALENLDWGNDESIFTVTNTDFKENALKIFGYEYTHNKLKGLRDLFLNANTVYCYRLNSGNKAHNDYATAKFSGTRGNNLKVAVSVNVDNTNMFDVITYLDDKKVDSQIVESANDLIDNDYLIFNKNNSLTITAGTPLLGGTNKVNITGNDYQEFLNKLEVYSFNTLGCLSMDNTIKALFVAFTKRMRDEMGSKFQTVIYNMPADYEGIINVKNKIDDENEPENSIIYWVTGVSAGCEVNKSNVNKLYTGEFLVNTSYKQIELESSIKKGEFILHKNGDEIRVLSDINSLITLNEYKNKDFQNNQVIRVLDQIGNDIAVLFNKTYLGQVPNNSAGRTSLWNDIVKIIKELNQLQAVENFESENVKVEMGDSKKSVAVSLSITPVCAMEQLYMTVLVS